MNITAIKNAAKIGWDKYGHKILIGGGIIAGAATVVTACIATRRVDPIIDEHKSKMTKIEEKTYEKKIDKTVDKVKTCAVTGLKMVDNYKVPIVTGASSVALICTGSNIIDKKYVGVCGTLAAVKNDFADYRKYIRENVSDEMDTKAILGVREYATKEDYVDEETGKKKSRTKSNLLLDDEKKHKRYVRIISRENNRGQIWDRNRAYVDYVIDRRVKYLNELRNANGLLTFNEALDEFGFDKNTDDGLVEGWFGDTKWGEVNHDRNDVVVTVTPIKVNAPNNTVEDAYAIEFKNLVTLAER